VSPKISQPSRLPNALLGLTRLLRDVHIVDGMKFDYGKEICNKRKIGMLIAIISTLLLLPAFSRVLSQQLLLRFASLFGKNL
jgi:hypothetical protein